LKRSDVIRGDERSARQHLEADEHPFWRST
jgi:hypothetical protein